MILVLVIHFVWENISVPHTDVHDRNSSPWPFESSPFSSFNLTIGALGFQVCITTSGFYMGFGNPNARPHAYERALYTDTSSLTANRYYGNIETLHMWLDLNSWLNSYLRTTADMEGQCIKQEIQITKYNTNRSLPLPWYLLLTSK